MIALILLFNSSLCCPGTRRPFPYQWRAEGRSFNSRWLFPTFLAPVRMAQVSTLLGNKHLELKDRPSALHWYGKGLLVPGQHNEELKSKVRAIIDTYETEDELNQIESTHRGAYVGGYAKWKLAQIAKRRGNDLLAKKILMELEKEYRGGGDWPQSKELSETISPSGKSKYALGV